MATQNAATAAASAMATSQPALVPWSLLFAAGAVFVAGGLVVTSLGSDGFFVREPVRRADEDRCWRRSIRLTTLRVFGPTMPSAASPLSAWKRRTAASVSGPKRPSTPGRPRL